jgi:hypothetical protein
VADEVASPVAARKESSSAAPRRFFLLLPFLARGQNGRCGVHNSISTWSIDVLPNERIRMALWGSAQGVNPLLDCYFDKASRSIRHRRNGILFLPAEDQFGAPPMTFEPRPTRSCGQAA